MRLSDELVLLAVSYSSVNPLVAQTSFTADGITDDQTCRAAVTRSGRNVYLGFLRGCLILSYIQRYKTL